MELCSCVHDDQIVNSFFEVEKMKTTTKIMN